MIVKSSKKNKIYENDSFESKISSKTKYQVNLNDIPVIFIGGYARSGTTLMRYLFIFF
jgi:hypothetical protein